MISWTEQKEWLKEAVIYGNYRAKRDKIVYDAERGISGLGERSVETSLALHSNAGPSSARVYGRVGRMIRLLLVS